MIGDDNAIGTVLMCQYSIFNTLDSFDNHGQRAFFSDPFQILPLQSVCEPRTNILGHASPSITVSNVACRSPLKDHQLEP